VLPQREGIVQEESPASARPGAWPTYRHGQTRQNRRQTTHIKGPKAASVRAELSAADPAHCSTPAAAIAKRSLHEEALPTSAPIKEPSRNAAATTLAPTDGAAALRRGGELGSGRRRRAW